MAALYVDSRFDGHRQPSHGIGRVVGAEQAKGKNGPSCSTGAIANVQPVEVLRRLADLRIGAGAEAEVDDTAGKIAPELRHIRI